MARNAHKRDTALHRETLANPASPEVKYNLDNIIVFVFVNALNSQRLAARATTAAARGGERARETQRDQDRVYPSPENPQHSASPRYQ